MDLATATLLLGLVGAAAPLPPGEDLDNGKDVAGMCAACHGAKGEGGKMGEYPRLAGQRQGYLAQQLRNYRARRRMNVPMFPYTEPRELPDRDLLDVSAFYAAIELPTSPPAFKDTDSSLDKLRALENVLIVPRVEGDVARGQALFLRHCAQCHGTGAQGRKSFPRLVGQYPTYLERQLALYRKGSRPHVSDEAKDDVLARMTPVDDRDVLAWVTSIQEQPLAPEEPVSLRRRRPVPPAATPSPALTGPTAPGAAAAPASGAPPRR